MARVIVAGAGISGLTAAYRLQRAGHTVTVCEAGDHVAGKMATSRGDGYPINRGAQLVPTRYADTLKLARDVGADADLEAFVPTLSIFRDGVEHDLRGAGPGMVVDGLRLEVLSPRSKLLLRRALVDGFRMRAALDFRARQERARYDVETVAAYSDRRLNAEIRDYVINPLMRGLFLIDADRIPILDFFFTAYNLLGAKLLRYPAGLDFLPRALAAQLDVRLGAPVERVVRGDRVEVTVDGRTERVDGCVLALPGPVVPRVYAQLPACAAAILTDAMPTTTVLGLHMGTAKPVRPHSVAITVPRVEREGLSTITFQDVYNTGAAPAGRGLTSAWFDHDWSAPRHDHSDEQLLAEMLPLVHSVLGDIEPQFTRIERWKPCTPLNRPGLHTPSAELDRVDDGRVQLAGDYFGLATINGAVVSGEVAAERLSAALHQKVPGTFGAGVD